MLFFSDKKRYNITNGAVIRMLTARYKGAYAYDQFFKEQKTDRRHSRAGYNNALRACGALRLFHLAVQQNLRSADISGRRILH